MNDPLYSFLSARVDKELEALSSVPGLPLPEAAELGRGLLFSRLRDLAEPVVEAWLQEELVRISPAVVLSPLFASGEDRESARRNTAQRLMRPEENPFAVYPLLGQDADRIGANFRSFLESFARRVAECRDRISRELLDGRPVGRLLSLSASGADAHLHGRCAVRVECEGGVFYYKPRDSRIDRLYTRMVAAFCPDCTRSAAVVCGDGYGFIENMKTAPIGSRKEAAKYYRNFGALTALFRFLGTSDMHYENILACGIYPVAIDLETLLTPAPDPFNGLEISTIGEMNPAWRDMLCSTQCTLVLPMMMQGKVQISPLVCMNQETAQCLPVLDGERIPVYGYEEEFIRGFDRMYDQLLARRGELAEMARAAADMSARFVMRASAYYALMLRDIHAPAGCATQEGRDKILADLHTHFKGHPEYLPVVEWERACLEEGDIPYLSFRVGQDILYGDPREEKLLDGYFKMTALARALLCIEQSGPEEKRFELDYIRRRFRQGPDVQPDGDKASPREAVNHQQQIPPSPLPAEEAEAQALRIMDDLWEMAIRLVDGDLILLSANKHLVPEYQMNFERGLPGMSVFFDRIRTAFTEDSRGETVRKASLLLEETRKDLLRSVRTYRGMTPALRKILHPGLCRGASGLFLSPCMDDRILTDILTILGLTTRGFEEEKPGLADGIAGLLLGCTIAYSHTQDGAVKEMLTAFAKRLSGILKARVNDPKPYSGLNHGMCGVGLALEQAFALTGSDECLALADKAYSLENDQYRDALGGWPDYSRSAKPVILGEHLEAGAPGIALAALLCGHELPAAKQLANKALACTLRLPFRETDDLASGNAGIVFTLIEAARRRGDPELLRKAGIRLAEMAARAARDGGYRSLPCRLRNAPDPAFWYGYAGIGYTMLEYAQAVRSV